MNIIKWLHNLRTRYILKHHPIPDELWKRISSELKILSFLTASEKAHLRVLSTLFIHKKTFTTINELELTDELKVIIAAQACLLILKLDLDYYGSWIEIIIYPTAFRVKHDGMDENGIKTEQHNTLSGESWLRGPVILSWQDVVHDIKYPLAGHNVIVHEFSHKLDMLNGRANGMPPLHPSMKIEDWTMALSTAYDTLQKNIINHKPSYINQYAATNPAEFFAVISEYFFTTPAILKQHCPEVYHQLTEFYRQNPLGKITA